MDNKILWFQLSFGDRNQFNNFFELFKSCLKQTYERNGLKAIFFPAKSFAYDYSEVFLSISIEDQEFFNELLLRYHATQLKRNKLIEIELDCPYYSDKDVHSEDEEASFI